MRPREFRGTVVFLWMAVLVALGPSQARSDYMTVIRNGPSSNRVDVVFLGDGYTAADIAAGVYDEHVSRLVSRLFDYGEEPFPRYRRFFNVHQIDVVSNESGADIPPQGIYRDTALDATYYADGSTERLLSVNTAKAMLRAQAELSGAGFSGEMRLVVVNDTKYGGSGGYFAIYAGGNSAASEIALHELGHSFGGLGDEYVVHTGQRYTGSEPPAPNVTINPNPATVEWSPFAGYTDPDRPEMGAIGVYEGAGLYQYGLYRPSQDSKMRTLGRPFCAVGREALILGIYLYVDPLDAWLPTSATLLNPGTLWVEAVDPDVIDVEWSVDGAVLGGAAGETLDLAGHAIAPGLHTVRALAYDNALGDWVRRDGALLQQAVTWTVRITLEGDVDGNGCVNVSDLVAVRVNLGRVGSAIDPPSADIDGNGIVNVSDFVIVRTSLGAGCL